MLGYCWQFSSFLSLCPETVVQESLENSGLSGDLTDPSVSYSIFFLFSVVLLK